MCKTQKSKKILVIVMLCIIVLSSILACTLALIQVIGNSLNLKYAKSIDTMQVNYVPQKDIDGNWNIIIDDNFKIMHLTDIHLGCGFATLRKDRLAMKAIVKMVKFAKPDLIITTGDIAYPIPIQGGSLNNKFTHELFSALMSSLGVPWAVTFGNHDAEKSSKYQLDTISEVYENAPNSLYQRGPTDIYGYGNYIIKLLNPDLSINNALFMIDSNSYKNDHALLDYSNYDIIHEDQVQWYANQATQLNGKKSIAFFHIPLCEYQTAWDLFRQHSDEVKYFGGFCAEKNELSYPGYKNNGLFDIMVDIGSTQAIFCGHDHKNNFSIEYKGIRLNYGMSIDYLAYIGIKNSHWQRGSKIISLKSDSSFEINTVVLIGLEQMQFD